MTTQDRLADALQTLLTACDDPYSAMHGTLGVRFVREIAQSALAAHEAEKPDREKDRARFPDPAFNEWLDTGISDSGHIVWHQIRDVCCAWHGWDNRQWYAAPAQPPAPEPLGDAWNMDYLPTAERIAKALTAALPHLTAKPVEPAAVPDEWRELMTTLADDLEAEINARSDGELPHRIERDLDPVRKARAMLASAPEPPK